MNKTIKPHSLQAWLAFVRPKTFWIGIIPVLVGTSFALLLENKFNIWTFLITLLGSVSIQAMSNMVNDYAYNVRKAENGTRVGLPRATTEGWISMSAAKRMIQFFIFICSIFGALLIVIGGWPIAIVAVLSILAAYCYMAGPLPIAYTPFGEFLVFIFYGIFAVVGTFWLQVGSLNTIVFVPGLSLGLLAAAVLFVNNYRDVEHDRSVGRKTLVAVLGKKICYYVYCAMVYCPFIFIGWLVPINDNYWPLLFTLLILPMASRLPYQLKTCTSQTATKVMLQTIKLELIFGFLLSLGGLASYYLIWNYQTDIISHILSSPF